MMNMPVLVANPVNAFGERIRNERWNFNLFARRQCAAFIGFERLFEAFPTHLARYDFFLLGMPLVFLQELHVFVRTRVGLAHELLVAEFIERFVVIRIEICLFHTKWFQWVRSMRTIIRPLPNFRLTTLNVLFRDISPESDAHCFLAASRCLRSTNDCRRGITECC